MNLPLLDFFDKIKTAIEQKKAFAVYRKPNQVTVNLQIQLDDALISSVDFKESGFVFAPFDTEKPSVFFPVSNSELFETQILDSQLNVKKIIGFDSDELIAKKFHIKLVDKAIKAINKNQFKKVVISRKEEVPITEFDAVKIYEILLQNYPTAMVYCWHHPKIGLWMGATPELLCKVEKNKFSTVALAGTQLVSEDNEVIWSEKENSEQQLVTDFIVDELKNEINNLITSNPYSVKAGHLWHIKTDIEGAISEDSSIEKIIKKLHPTPAVCGLPKESAKDFILKNEHYNREFYTGYLGEITIDDASTLFVNLRCMKVEKEKISIFVGGGITKDSHPEKEWNETVSKAKTMKSCFYE